MSNVFTLVRISPRFTTGYCRCKSAQHDAPDWQSTSIRIKVGCRKALSRRPVSDVDDTTRRTPDGYRKYLRHKMFENQSPAAPGHRREHQVVAIIRKSSDPTNFVELGHVSPRISQPRIKKRSSISWNRGPDALGVEFGATDTEIILGKAGPSVIETHIRMGGDEIPALAFDATGVDLADCLVRQTLGEKVLSNILTVLAENRRARSSAIWFLAAPAAGELVDMSGLDEAGETEGVTEVKLLVRPGSTIGNLESSDARIADVRAIGKTPELAVNSARKCRGAPRVPVTDARCE